MEKPTLKISIPYLGKIAVIGVVSFSCAISAYQIYQNTNIFSPSSLQTNTLKNNQVVFPGQDQQSLNQKEKNNESYSKQKNDAQDQITPKNQSQSSFLFEKNQQILNNNISNLSINNPITGTSQNNNQSNNSNLSQDNNTLVINPNSSGDGNKKIVLPEDGRGNGGKNDTPTNNNGDSTQKPNQGGNNTTKPDSNNNSQTPSQDDNKKPNQDDNDPQKPNQDDNDHQDPSQDDNEKPGQDDTSTDNFPDPEAKLPDVSKLPNIFGNVDSYTGEEENTSSSKYTYEVHAYDVEDMSFFGLEPTSPIYYGKKLDKWTLLCNTLFLICRTDENGNKTFFYINEFNDNFKIGTFPKKATKDFKVKYYFRLNKTSSWQKFEVQYKVEHSRVILLGYDQTELKSIYVDNDKTINLKQYYDLILNYGQVKQFFLGWSETPNGKAVNEEYHPTKKGKIILYPKKLIDIPDQFVVELQKEYYPENSKYVLKNIIADEDNYNIINEDIYVPDEIDEIDFENNSDTDFGAWVTQNGNFYIPKNVKKVTIEDYSYYINEGEFVVDKENPYLCAENGLLMDKDKKTLIYSVNKSILELPETLETIQGYSLFIEEIHFKNPLNLKNINYFKNDEYTDLYVPEEDYLKCFKQWYGVISNNILSEDGLSHDYDVTGGMIFETIADQKTLIGVLSTASGTIVIPDDVTHIADNAFSDNKQISRIVFTSGNMILGSQILKGSSVNEILFLSENVPSIQEDTFIGVKGTMDIQVATSYLEDYKQKWLEKDHDIVQQLSTTESGYKEVNDFEYLEIFYKNETSTVILLNAPSSITEFNSQSIPNVVVSEIGDSAFSECTHLKYVELDKSIKKIGKYAFYGCEELEGIYSMSEDTITIEDEGLEINDRWDNNLRFISFNANNALFENNYTPSNYNIIYAPYNGTGYPTSWGQDLCNKYSFKYDIENTNGGHILYGEARGTTDQGESYSIDGQYYLIKATTQVEGDYITKAYTFEICQSAFENVPITSIELHMTTDSYYIDSNAFENTQISGEIILPDGLTHLSSSAYAHTNITRFVFPKIYNENAVLETGVFFETNSLKEIVFQNANPINLSLYNMGTAFSFGIDAQDLKINLQEEAVGKEKDYIENWKYYFAGVSSEDDLIWYPWCSLDDALNTLQQLFNYTLSSDKEADDLDVQSSEQKDEIETQSEVKDISSKQEVVEDNALENEDTNKNEIKEEKEINTQEDKTELKQENKKTQIEDENIIEDKGE